SEVMRAIRPEVTCSTRPNIQRGGTARASRWSTNARSGASWRATGTSGACDPSLLRLPLTQPTIRPAGATLDGTGVRLPLEAGERAVQLGCGPLASSGPRRVLVEAPGRDLLARIGGTQEPVLVRALDAKLAVDGFDERLAGRMK